MHNYAIGRIRLVQKRFGRRFSFTPLYRWQKFENERHYEPGEDIRRVWHGLTYDFRRAARRYREVLCVQQLDTCKGSFRPNMMRSEESTQ